MMTEGEKTVVLVRAQALSDALRAYLARARNELREGPTDWPQLARDYLSGEMGKYLPPWLGDVDPTWEAQRLLSSVERALGTRERHYDPKEEE